MSRRDYNLLEIRAARLVLADLFELLEEYREGIVLVGGWVPFLPSQTIEEILSQALYQQDTQKAFRWHKGMRVDGENMSVVVDFLTGEEPGFANGRLQRIQDIAVSTMRGCEAAFVSPTEVALETLTPEGKLSRTTFRMASIAQILVMKGLALHNRNVLSRRESSFQADARKDAYDIYFVVKNYEGGLAVLSASIRPYLHDPLLRESFRKIAAKWKCPGDVGPTLIATREEDEEERGRIQRDVYEQVRALFESLGGDWI